MDANELRALADALDSDPARGMAVAADYLRAQADAQPVAWIGPSRPKIDGADHRVLRQDYDASHGYGWSRDTAKANGFLPLYTHPAPAAPPHAMLDSHRRLIEQAIQSAEHPSGMSTHDGKARIDASVLRRMLAIIDSLPAAPQSAQQEK